MEITRPPFSGETNEHGTYGYLVDSTIMDHQPLKEALMKLQSFCFKKMHIENTYLPLIQMN